MVILLVSLTGKAVKISISQSTWAFGLLWHRKYFQLFLLSTLLWQTCTTPFRFKHFLSPLAACQKTVLIISCHWSGLLSCLNSWFLSATFSYLSLIFQCEVSQPNKVIHQSVYKCQEVCLMKIHSWLDVRKKIFYHQDGETLE